MRSPSPPVVAGALSGFVVGVLLTLLATGTVSRQSSAISVPPTPPPATLVSDAELIQRIDRMASRILGPLPSNPRKSRLLDAKIYPVTPADLDPGQSARFSNYRSVFITFRLNNHPFGPSWRLRAAKADVFAVMRALYTSQLYIYDVQMNGRFPLDRNQPNKLQTATRVYLAYNRAITLPWRRWGRSDESRLWKVLTTTWVDPRFG